MRLNKFLPIIFLAIAFLALDIVFTFVILNLVNPPRAYLNR